MALCDNICLAKSMISYAEAMDIDGAIVALDQEKPMIRYAMSTCGKP